MPETQIWECLSGWSLSNAASDMGSCTGVGCAEGTWRGCGGCCGVWEVDERTDDAACNSNIA